jgi:hypothetical protein
MKNGDEFYTTKETADLLGLKNHQTLAKWRCNKKNLKLKYVKIGGAVKYLKTHIDKFIADNTVGID